MEAYCGRQGLTVEQLRFLFDGNRLQPTDTPSALGMEDNDVIGTTVSPFRVAKSRLTVLKTRWSLRPVAAASGWR